MTKPSHDVERYYDFIYYWAQITNRFRAFRDAAPYAIHRGLVDEHTGEWRTETIHDLIAEAVRDLGPIDALDAGCGYGGSMMGLHEALGGRWHGITINRHQIRIARRNARSMGCDDALTFELASYDDPLPRPFNLIYGIESLIHSADPARTISNLAAGLMPRGRLIIVDDMPIEDVPARYTADLERFKSGWRCPVAPTARQWIGHCEASGLSIRSNKDLTPQMRPRSEPEVLEALAGIERKRRWRRRFGLSMVTDAELGGLMLERLTRERIVEHRMIVAERPA